jgi:hypothetical protein
VAIGAQLTLLIIFISFILIGLFASTSIYSLKLAFFMPLITLFGVYLPGGVRSDLLILFFLVFMIFIYNYKKGGGGRVDSLFMLYVVFTVYTLFSTYLFAIVSGTFEYISIASFTMLQYWVKIALLVFVAINIAHLYERSKTLNVIVIFYTLSILILIFGILETLRVVPDQYYKLINIFIPPNQYFMREKLLSSVFMRASSILSHPSVFAYLALWVFWITLVNQSKFNRFLNRYFVLFIVLLAGICSGSKLFYFGIPIIILYEYVYVRKKYMSFLLVCFLIIMTLFIFYTIGASGDFAGTIFHKIYYLIWAMYEYGIYEVVFRTRFDGESGLLASSYDLIQNNLFFGVGTNYIDGVFYGDSFYVSTLLKYGVLGFALLMSIQLILIKRVSLLISNVKDLKFRNFLHTLRGMMVLNLIIGIAIDSYTVLKLSEIIYLFIFIIYYGEKFQINLYNENVIKVKNENLNTNAIRNNYKI